MKCYKWYHWYKKLIVRNTKTGKEREIFESKKILSKWKLGIGDHINNEEIIVKIIGGEVKKLSRPYFETKVVKIKKEETKVNKLWEGKYWGWISEDNLVDLITTLTKELKNAKSEKEKEKGNWVNGENLDKIKFPCFCSFSDPFLKDYRYGMIINEGYFKDYILIEIKTSGQSFGNMVRDKKDSLKKLIIGWNIHILKGKIIIFEEE